MEMKRRDDPPSRGNTSFGESITDENADSHTAETAAFVGVNERVPMAEVSVPGYEILGRLGRGGMGVVYKARDQRLDRIVALKLIVSGDSASSDEVARFNTEAQAAARVQHPNVVQIFEVGTANGQPYLCMEFVDGDSLSKRLNGTPWRGEDAARLIETLARAIDTAHQQGVVHRDLKPANILLAGTGGAASGDKNSVTALNISAVPGAIGPGIQPKIGDFGLAKLLEATQGQTQSGAFLGTASYAAPEQADGRAKSIGPHTDVYALGAILYELLTGRPPFKGATLLDTIHQVLHQEPVSPRLLNPAIAADLEVICLKCLEKSPERRYGSSTALADDLRRWLNNEPIVARPPGVLGRAARWCLRHPALASLACIFLMAAAGVTWQWREAVAAEGRAEERRKEAVTAGKLAEERRKQAVASGELAEKRRRDAVAASKQAAEEAAAAQEISRFLSGVFEDTDLFGLTGRSFGGDLPKANPSALDILDRGARKLAEPGTLRDKPLVRATLLDKVGNAYASLGHAKKAAPLLTESLALRRAHLPADHIDVAESLHNLGFLELTRGSLKKSAALLSDAIALRTRRLGPKATPTLATRFYLGFALSMSDGANNRGRDILTQTAAIQRERLKEFAAVPDQFGREAFALCCTLLALTQNHLHHDDFLQAAALIPELKKVARAIPNKDVGAVVVHLVNGKQWEALGQSTLAESELRTAVLLIEKSVGKGHFFGNLIEKEHATLLFNMGRYDEAEAAFLYLGEAYRTTFGEEANGLPDVYYTLARIIERGRLAKAMAGNSSESITMLRNKVEEYARAAVDIHRNHDLLPMHRATHALYCGHVLLRVRTPPDLKAAEDLLRQAWHIRKKTLGAGDALTLHPFGMLLQALTEQQKLDEAEGLFRELTSETKILKWRGDPAGTLPTVARQFAAAGRGKTAVRLLEAAAQAGYRDARGLRTDPAFAPLLELDEFQSLLRNLETRK